MTRTTPTIPLSPPGPPALLCLIPSLGPGLLADSALHFPSFCSYPASVVLRQGQGFLLPCLWMSRWPNSVSWLCPSLVGLGIVGHISNFLSFDVGIHPLSPPFCRDLSGWLWPWHKLGSGLKSCVSLCSRRLLVLIYIVKPPFNIPSTL